MRACALGFLLLQPILSGAETRIHLTSAPALSADGSRIVFEWSDDLWTAASEGGEAKRVVHHPGRDAYPRFSPDGKRIVFSSERSGSMQVYSLPVEGGETIRHTHHSEGNELECLSPDGRSALVRGIRDRAGVRATLLMEIDLTGERRERRIFDATAHSPAWSPDGASVLFCRGGDQLYRQGFSGSRATRIWRFNVADRSFHCEIPGTFEARWPLWLPDGSGFYFASNQGGTSNLWLKKHNEQAVQLTFYQEDGVITPDLSADGSTLVFRHGSGLFRLRPGTDKKARAIELSTCEPLPDLSEEIRRISGCAAADFTPDLQQVVFSAAGELWWIPSAGEKPRRLTETPAAEEEPRFSPDGKWLYFLRDDGIEANYHRARFQNGTLHDAVAVTRGKRSKCRLEASPDGAMIAWIEGTGDVFTARADGSDPRLVFPCWDKPTIEWAPHSQWLAVAAEDRNSNRDILLVDPRGARKPVNLTRHPAFEGSPKWSPDGRWLVFSAKRGTSGKSALWKIDFGPGGPAADRSAESLIQAGERAAMISTRGIEPIRVMWSPDSKNLLFQSRNPSSNRLISVGVDGGSPQTVAERRGIPIRIAADGSMLWRVNQTPEMLAGGKPVAFPIDLTVTRQRSAVLALNFRRIWRTLGGHFHDPRMNGRDWDAMLRKYEPAAAMATNSKQFDVAVSRLLGELNASHLSFLHDRWPGETNAATQEQKTAHPGWVFDDSDARPDAPLRIREVLPGAPVALLENPPLTGDVIVRIAGKEVVNGSPVHEFFTGAEGRVLPVVLRDAVGNERTIEARCISYQKARSLEQLAREDRLRRQVAAAMPDTAYIAVRDMNRESLASLELAVHRAEETCDKLILDFRDNGGGREADRMLNLFTQPRHSFTIPRGGPKGFPLDRRPAPAWDHPMVVLCNANTFSNSEIFCHAIQQSGRAPLVGVATAGGVISAVRTRIPEAGVLQVPFRSWFDAESGKNLDLNGAQPDHPVDLGPADEDAGRDPQCEKAIAILRGVKWPE